MSAHADSGSSDELDPDEPRTPLWLPLLGLSLFVAALIYVLLSGQKPATDGSGAPAPSSAVAAAPENPAH
jgi:hypothetical protein